MSGTNGILKADNGATVTLTDISAGTTTTLTSDTGGTVNVVLSGGLRAGRWGYNVSVGTGSLDDTVSAINNANMGVIATEVQVSAGVYKLQLSSTTTGANSAVNVGANAFSGIGTMNTLVAAQDAQLTVGSGAAAYQVTSASNTVSNLMPGVTLSLLTTSVDRHRQRGRRRQCPGRQVAEAGRRRQRRPVGDEDRHRLQRRRPRRPVC